MSENLICKRVWWATVTMGISKVILCRKYVGVIYTGGLYYNNNRERGVIIHFLNVWLSCVKNP